MKIQIKEKKPTVIHDPLDKTDENRDWLRKKGKSMGKSRKPKKQKPWQRPGFLKKTVKKGGYDR